ncbi:MAG: TolC family outer membrane protein [Acidiferrobacterales bacterium]
MKFSGFRISGVILALLLASGNAQALDLVQSYNLAKQADPVFLGASEKYQADKLVLRQADSALLPTISGTADATRYQTPSAIDSKGYTLSITQPLLNFGVFAGIGQARAEVRRAEAEYSAAQQDLMLRVAQAYLGALAAQDGVELAQAERDAISQQLEVAEGRLSAGLGTITEVHDARARFQFAEASLLDAKNKLSDSLEALSELTGSMSETLKTLKSEIPTVHPQPENQEQWVDTAEKQNLSILASQAAYDASRKQVQIQRSGHFPSLSLFGRISDNESSPTQPADGRNDSVGIQLTVPIFQGGYVSASTSQARHLREAARQQLEASRRGTRRLTRNAYAGVVTGIERVAALKQSVIAGESALTAKQTGFEAGINTNLDVLNAQRDLFIAKRDYAQSRYTYILDLLRLKQAAGQLNEKDLQEVNGWLQ